MLRRLISTMQLQSQPFTWRTVSAFDRIDNQLLVGREAIVKDFEGQFAASMQIDSRKTVQMYSVDDRIVLISEYRAGMTKGHSVTIYLENSKRSLSRLWPASCPHCSRLLWPSLNLPGAANKACGV